MRGVGRPIGHMVWILWLVVAAVAWDASLAQAQDRRSFSRGASPEDENEDEKLTTKDGVRLGITFYPSSLGKEAVPIVMLHDVEESRAVYHGLAQALQAPNGGEGGSYAVLTVDLRGHGESTTAVDNRGDSREIDPARLKNRDYQNMVRYDMEAVRKFLVGKNDAQQLNLNKLCLVGSGLGANVATTWTAVDWSAPRLPRIKQGQDVKALILASPKWSSWGMPLLKAIKHPDVRQSVAVLLAYGKQESRATKDAKNIHKNLKKYHDEPPRGEVPDLYLYGLPTRLQGTKLLVDREFGALPRIEAFINAHVAEQDFEWLRRRSSN